MKRILILFLIIIVVASCEKNESPTTISNPLEFVPGHGAFIVNEGIFQQNDASISYLNLDSLIIHNNIFSNANNGVSLGDVAQSITINNNEAYIVLNNSHRIECVNSSNFKVISSIDGFVSPSSLLNVASGKAYVSDSFANKVSIVNTQGNTVSGTINIGGPTGNMLQWGDQVFVVSPSKYNVYVINSGTDALTDSVPVGNNPTSLCVDKNGMLWVYCAGDYANSITPSLYEIVPFSHGVIGVFSFPSGFTSEGSLCMNAAADSLYFIHHDVFKMAITDKQLPTTSFISAGSMNFYGLLKTPDGRIIVCDAKNLTQDGAVYVYSAGGALLKGLNASVVPGQIVFY